MLDLLYIDLIQEVTKFLNYQEIFSLSLTNKKILYLLKSNNVLEDASLTINNKFNDIVNKLSQDHRLKITFNEYDLIEPRFRELIISDTDESRIKITIYYHNQFYLYKTGRYYNYYDQRILKLLRILVVRNIKFIYKIRC